MLRKLRNLHLATILILFITPASLRGERTRWVSVQEIYAKGKHNAWPDMCRWRDKIYVVFPAPAPGTRKRTVWWSSSPTTPSIGKPCSTPDPRTGGSKTMKPGPRRRFSSCRPKSVCICVIGQWPKATPMWPPKKNRSSRNSGWGWAARKTAGSGGSCATSRLIGRASGIPPTAERGVNLNSCWNHAGGSGGRKPFGVSITWSASPVKLSSGRSPPS